MRLRKVDILAAFKSAVRLFCGNTTSLFALPRSACLPACTSFDCVWACIDDCLVSILFTSMVLNGGTRRVRTWTWHVSAYACCTKQRLLDLSDLWEKQRWYERAHVVLFNRGTALLFDFSCW